MKSQAEAKVQRRLNNEQMNDGKKVHVHADIVC